MRYSYRGCDTDWTCKGRRSWRSELEVAALVANTDRDAHTLVRSGESGSRRAAVCLSAPDLFKKIYGTRVCSRPRPEGPLDSGVGQ